MLQCETYCQLRSNVKAPIDTGFLRQVEDKIRVLSPYRTMRFRSSTNAEDLESYNGAGLYESHTGTVGSSDASIDEAIKKVWASLWTLNGYEVRAFFRINQLNVAMGILVHRAFPDEGANGVAITRNIYNDNLPGITINAQIDEVSVVSPPAGFVADQCIFHLVIADAFERPAIEYISRSNVSGGKAVLTEAEIVLLAKHCWNIRNHFCLEFNPLCGFGSPGDAMDIEFKFDGPERKLYIKQARPYR
jgi:pyruvate,water dikinase